jgi:hypothetical protein
LKERGNWSCKRGFASLRLSTTYYFKGEGGSDIKKRGEVPLRHPLIDDLYAEAGILKYNVSKPRQKRIGKEV